MFDEQDRKYFYDEFKKNGYVVGSYDDFKHDLGNKEDREWYYNEAKKMGYDVGSSSDFDKMVMEPASQPKAQQEAVQQPSQSSNVPNSVPEQQEQQPQQPQPKVQSQNASASQVTMEQPKPGEVVDGITGETILVQTQQEPKKMVDNTSKSVQQIYDSYANGNKGYAFSNTVADLLAKGVTDDPDEARNMVKNAVYNAADRSTLAITNNMAKQLGDSTQNEEEMVKGMYYSHDVQDKLQAEANKHGFEYNDYVNSFVKPALVESLVSRYGENHRKLAQGIAARLFSHEGDVTNVLMNQDINDAMVGVVSKYVSPSVVDEFNKAEEASNKLMSINNEQAKNVYATSPFNVGAITEANNVRDPQKILDDLQKKFSKLYQNPQFLNDLSTATSNVLQKYGMIGNMKGDPKQYKSMIEAVIKNELDQLEIKKLIPKGSAEYIVKTGLGNSIVGKIYRKLAHSDYQNQLEDIANAQYQPGFWERLGSGTLTFAADAWSYWLPGAAGGRLTRSMIAKAEGKLATDLMAHGMERGVAERAARVLIGRSKAVALKTGAAHGAVTFGGQSVISTPIDEVYRTGQFDENGERYNPSVGRIALNTLKEGGKGALVGTLMQGSTIANMIGKGKGLATNILADVGGTALDASIMGGQQILERMNEDPDFKPTGKDIAATIAESAVNLKTIGLPGLVGKYRGFKTAREFNRKYNFTDADIAELKAHGYDDLRSAFENSAVHGYKPVKNEQTGRVELQEDTSARVEEHHLIQQYMNLMNDKNVPEVLKAKMMAVVEGKRPSALSNVVDTEVYRGDDGKYYLETLNNDGGVIDRKAYSSHEAARKDEKKLEYTKTLGVTSELEQAYHTDALQERLDDLYNQAAQKYNMGEKLTDEDTAAIYLHQNAGAIKDIIAKQQRGEMLTDEEQQKVDIYRKYYDSAFANSPIMTEYVRTFEDSQGVAHGTLRKALESKDEKYKDLVKSYQEQLYNDIVLKRDTKQTADNIYNEYRGNGQPRLEQNGAEGTGENDVPNGEGTSSTTSTTEGVPPVEGGAEKEKLSGSDKTTNTVTSSLSNDTALTQSEGVGKDTKNNSSIQEDPELYKVANSLKGKVGQSLAKEEAVGLVVEMEKRAEPARDLELTPENWIAEFGEDGKVSTPLGEVKMGESQYFKLAQEGRNGKLGLVKPTLENPDVIIEDASQAKEGQVTERPSSYLFVKTFSGKDGNRVYYFTSVTVSRDGKEVVVSNQERRANRIATVMESGKILYLKGNQSASVAQNEKPVSLGDSNFSTTTGSQEALHGINSPDLHGKDTNNSSNGNGAEATLTFENAFAEGQNAYKNGDAESLVRINHEDDVAPIRVERAFKDNEKGLFAVYDAMNDGEDMEAFIAKHQDELTPQQVDAIRKWVAAKEATKGVQDALQHADDGYGESLKEQIWPYATEDGNIVPVTLTNGRTAFLKKANEYGGAFVVIPSETGEPEVKMIPNAEIKNSGTPVPIDDYVAQRVAEKQEASKNALMETIGEQQPQPNEKVMVAMEADEEPAEMIFEGYNTKGDVVLSDGKEYVSVSQVKFDHWRANAKRSIINAELDAEDAQQEQTALAKQEAERKKRYADNIVGYGDGKIDYSSKDSNPKVVAEYLQEEYGENHDKLMKLVNGSRGDIKEQLDNKRKKAAEYQSWLDMNSDIDPETANKVKDELAQVNEEIADLEGRYDKWNAIRKEVMTDEDVRTMKEERTQNIKKVGVDESALPTDDEPEVPIISKDELKKQYATKDEARAYITDERKRIKNMQYDILSQINGIDDMLEKYKQGDIDLSDEELRDLNTTKAQLEARQNDLTNSAKGLKELDGKLNILYIRETAEANKKAVDDVSTPEGRKAILDRAWRKYKRGKGKSKNPAQLWGDTVGKTLKRLYGRLPVDIFDTTPHTAEEYVVNGITPFGLNYEGNKYSKGVKQETGLSRKDFAGTHLLAAKGKGRTVDQIVHDLWENRRDENLDNLTEDEIRNAFISLITSGIDAYDIRYAHIDRKVAEAEKYLEEQQEAAENAEAEYMAEQKRRAENPDEEVPTILDNDLPFTPGADDDNLPFDRGGKKGNASTANMTEPQKVAYNAVRTMLKNAGIPVKVKTNEEMEEVARKEDERRLTQLLANPRVHFQIKTPEQREAAKNAYDWATEHRPDKWKQYAVVDMDHPNQLPTYYEKQELAKKDSVYYTNLLWGNYKVFDLNKPFDEQTSKLTGKFPEKFDPSKGEELRIKVQELEKQRQEAENAYKAKQEERSEYNAKLMKDYMNEHGLATENDIPDDVWNKLREKSFEKYQDELDGLFNRYVDLDKQLKYMNRSGVKFLEGDGIVYGYTDGKEIVLNQDHLNPDTPLHEYQHIWRMAAKEKNPDLIAHGDELIKQTSLFEELKNDPNYKHLNDEQLCDEAFSRLTGEDGEKILEKMAEDAIKENPLDTAKELNVINRLKKWLKDFWYWTLDTFTKWKPEDIKKMTLEDIRNLVLRDLAKGVDPREVLKKPQTQNYKRNYELSEKEKNETTERIDKRIAELNRLEKEQSLKSEHGNLAESHEHGYLPSNINIDGVQSVAPLNAKIDKKFLPKNFYLENLAKFITSMGNDADITTDNFTKKLFEGLGMTPHGRNMQVSEYFKYQTDDGGKVTVRLSDHSGNALSIIKKGGRADKGYSIVINLDTSPKTKFKPNKFANVVEYIYNNPDSEGLKNIARSIFNLIDTDEYLDLLGATDINVSPRGKTIVDAKTDKEVMKFSNRLKSAIDETETSPSDAQKESGNYKKGHLKFGGYDYTIENPKGSTRSGVDENGKPWSQTMHDTYGYIRGKFGKDGDHLDMFINDGADLDTWNGNVYVVDQVDPKTGEFDEHKVMYGFDSEEEAKKAYLSNYEEGWKGLGSITGVSKDVFDKWVDSSKRKLKPFAEHSISKDARDDEYLEAVKYGDMEKAQKMVNEAAEAAGYSTDSSYQGTSAFNGAAPWGNGYFLTKEERKEAWDNGEFEGESTLGDYINDDIDGGNLEDLTNTASYRSADPMRKEAIDNVRNAIQKKRKTITMYRSVPSDVREGSFRNGDWVTPSRAYAVDNAKLHGWGNDYNIIKQEVPVDDVWFDGNDIAEWGYGREEDYINDTDFAYKNTKNNRKLLDAVTYDDKGNVIPLSQRFNEKSPDIRFSRRTEKKDEEKTMLGMHNITLSKLIKAIKQGGFAAPSMGVIDSKNGIYSDYGEITLIPKAEKLAKSKGKNAGTFLGDGWTPIYPSVEKVMNKQGEKVFNKDMDKLYDDVDVTLWSNIKDSWKRYFSDGDVSDGLYFQYLQEKGMNPETVYQKGRYDAEISKEVMRISDNGRKSNFTDDEVAKLIELKNKATGEDNDVDSMRKKLEKQLENAKIRENDLLFALKKKRLSDLEGIGNSDIAADFAKDVAKDARYANKPSIFDTMRSAMLKVSNDKLYSDFTNWLENKSDEYGAEEMLYTGTTPTGKPKYIPNTVENAVKLMKKKELAGGYGMFGSIGSFIAKHSDMATTLKQMKAAKNKLISKADAEKRDEKRDEIYREYRSLANQLDVPGGYSFDSGDARMLELADHKGHEKEYIKKVYNMDVSDEWVDRYNKLVNTIKNDYPVFYFETKFMRPYGLDEFEKAIVPKDTPKDVVDALKKAGIDVRTYESKEDREKVTMDAVHGSDDILFHRGDTSAKEPTHEEVVLRDAVIDKLRGNGMDVITDTDEGQSVLDSENRNAKFFRTPDGEAYGYTIGGKIYIDPRIANSDTPIHEYSHLWSEAVRNSNPEEWENIVNLMKGVKPIWDKVKTEYPDLKTDSEIADEVLAHYSGKRGAERLRQEYEAIADGDGSITDKAKAMTALQRVKNVLDRFWKAVADFLHIHYTSAEEVADRVMKDLLDGIDPREYGANGEGISYSKVTDPKTIEKLDKEETVKVYRAMQLGEDGKLYPPMAAKVKGQFVEPIELGKWEQADERPELADDNGMFTLNKGNGKSLKAAYNPYLHTSRTPLNDQFSEAQSRPNLVTVEVEVPKSELTSGYKADKAKDAVGEVEWKAGIVQGQLTGKRKVVLSRWDKPIRIVPDSEVADVIKDMLDGQDITMPSNVVTPSLRKELEKRGVPFVETDNRGRIVGGENDGVHYSKIYGKNAKSDKSVENNAEFESKANDFTKVYRMYDMDEYGLPDYAETAVEKAKETIEKELRDGCNNDPAIFFGKMSEDEYDKLLKITHAEDFGLDVPFADIHLEEYTDEREELYDDAMYNLPGEMLKDVKNIKKYIPREVIDAMIPKNPKIIKMSRLPEEFNRQLQAITGMSHDEVLNTYGVDNSPQMLTDEDYEAVQNSKKANVKMALGDKIGRTAESVEKEQNITDSVVNTANQLGGAEANVYTSEEQVPDKYKDAVKKGGKGWYDPETHSVHVYLPNCEDANDAQRTVFHEKVGHEGMEVLLGGESGVRKFANFVYNSVGKSIREKILDFAKKYDSKWENPDRLNVGTQEYIAHLAEEGPQTAEDFSLWTKMKHYLIKALKKLNIRIPGLLNDKDLRYYLMKAGKALHVWDNMPKEQQEAMMSQATGKEIKNALSENKGKPKRKKGESMAQYMNRVLEWEKWRDARADKSDPEPPQFYDIDKDPEGKKEWEQLNKDWRARHQLTGEDMPARPERKPGESDDDYMARIKDYEKWQQAMKDDRDPMPDMFAWEKQKQDEASQKYEDWLTRHELNEQQNADLDLYEGRTHVAETNPKADDADKQLMQDLADVTSTDVSKDGAARSVKYAVIRRRKNMEEAMADDAIVINDIKRNIEQMAESGVVDKVLSSYTGNESKAEKLAESIPYIIEAPRRVRDLTNQLNASGAFEKNHISIQPQDVINLQPLVEDFAAAIKMHEETVVNEKGEPEKVLKYDDPHAASEMASKIANVINSYHELDADFVPVDGTDILSDNVRQIVAYSQIAPKGVEWQNLSPEMRKTLNAIRDWYNYTYTWLKDNHTLRDDAGYNIDYVNHVWDKDASDEDAYRTYVENRQRTKSPNEKPRTISTLMEGISLGLVPKTTDITKLMGTYSKNNIEAYANKSFLQEVSGLNVVERDEKGEVVSSDPVLSSTPPFNLEQYKYFEVPGVGPVWVYNVSPKQVEVTNPLTGNRHVPYSQHSAASRFGAVMETYESNPFWKKFDEVSGLAKKLELGFSGFHAGALTEVYMVQNMPEFGPKKAMAYFWKYIMGDTMKNGQLPCYANPEDFQDAAAHLVKFGATSDYSATDVQNMFDSLRGGLETIRKRMNGNIAQKTVGTVTLPMEVVSQFLSMANKGMDVALWDFLHDGLKMATYKLRSERTRARAAKEGWTQTQLDMALDEDGQFVNDMFGGQHWDVLGVSRKTIRKCGRWLLSPDWNASTTRHFLAMTGYGSIWNEATAENFKEYYKNLWAKVRGKGKLSPDDWQRLSRQKSALICYGIGFSIFYEAIANAVNAAFRAMDEEKEKKKADEIRKTNPDYKSAYELAYPEGMKWYDYLMGGNSLGQQSKIYVGRYADGTEMYIRHGKQFREVPEYLFNSKGEFEFPGPFVHRLLGKANPMLRMALDDINYLSDFQTSHADQELQRKYGKALGLIYKDALYFAPFLIPSQENKEFKMVDFCFPSAKGFSNWKAQDYFKTFLLSGDMKGMMLTYNSCVKNGLDAEKQLQAAISSVKALEANEMQDGVTSLQIATDRFNKAKGLTEKRKMREKIRKFLSQSEYKVFTAQQAMDMVKAYQEGEDFKDLVKADDKYLMVATSADVTEDWRIQSVRTSTKQYADKLSEMKENHPEAAKEFVQANKRIFDARRDIERANRNMNKLKKQLGKGNDKKVLDQIRKARKELLKKLNGMEKR